MNTGRDRNSHFDALRAHPSMIDLQRCFASIFIACIFFAAASGCGKHRTAHAPAPPKPARIGKTEKGVASWYGIPYHGRRAASGEVFDMEQLTAAHRTLPFQTWVMVTNLDNGKKVDVRITDRGPFVDNRVIDLSKAAAREIDMLGSGTARVKLKVIKPPKNVVAKIAPPPVTNVATNVPISSGESLPPLLPSATPASPQGSQAEIPSQPLTQNISPDAPSEDVTREPSSMPVQTTYTVQAGAFSSQKNAEALRDRLQFSLRDQAIVRIEPRTGPSGKPLWFVLAGDHLSREAAAALAAQLKSITGDGVVAVDTRPI